MQCGAMPAEQTPFAEKMVSIVRSVHAAGLLRLAHDSSEASFSQGEPIPDKHPGGSVSTEPGPFFCSHRQPDSLESHYECRSEANISNRP